MAGLRPVVIALAAWCAHAQVAHGECAPEAGGAATVVRAIDGQTLELDDGSAVRLVGALAPETPSWWKKPEPWPPAEAARAALERLAAAQTIELRYAPGEERLDRHGRRLAQVFVLQGEERLWAQARMVREGHALAWSLSGHRACARELQAHESAARAARAGLWRTRRFAVRGAGDAATLLKRRGSYQLVEGRVHSVGETRNWSFLNFGTDWKTDFTVAVPAGDRRAFEGSDVALDALEGKRVRVRGWIERWNGPAIKATHPEQIEILDEAPRAGPRPRTPESGN
jgi:endonuclease YncB( thermonuclease family)